MVLDEIILGERWAELQEELRGYDYSLVVLAPGVEIVTAVRDLKRAKRPLGPEWAHYLEREFRRTMTGAGLWIDNTEQSPEETAREVLDRLAPGRGP